MSPEIHLLGSPRIGCGDATQPRGRKAWALLALIVLSDRPLTRERAAELLFPTADDPRAALRWSLSQLRNALGDVVIPEGRLELALAPGAFVDVRVLADGDWRTAIAVPGCGRELLEAMSFPGCVAFEAWLLAERRYLIGLAEQALREAALVHLAEGDPRAATALAARLVELNSYDESFQELLVRSYAEAGDLESARQQARAAADLTRRELGREPTAAIAQAAVAPLTASLFSRGRVAIAAQYETGLSAVRAGAAEAGIEGLKMAAAAAHAAGYSELEARALAAAGGALVHAARGRNGEGAVTLHRAIVVAELGGHTAVAATACSELGYVEVLAARYERAAWWLARAAEHGRGDDGALAVVYRNRGMALSDVGRYEPALVALERSLAHAGRAGDHREQCFALSLVGRVHLLRQEMDRARPALEQSLALAAWTDWTTFRSWPEALLACAELAAGERAVAAERLEHAFALGCQLDDACWEALAQRGLALVAAARGELMTAIELLLEARHRAVRQPDTYRWVALYVLDALCETAVSAGDERAGTWIAELRESAAKAGMRELLVRSHLHAARGGQPAARLAGRALLAGVQNPALRRAFG
jgi:DNA-binding SARP family transcriptional activator